MQADGQTSNFTDRDNSCIATQQKAVYNWYESRHSDDEVVDIYSPQWQERITTWYNWFIDNFGSEEVPMKTVKSWKTPEEIDFRIYFFAHPVATFSLWHVLQAFYEIDEAVCGTASDAQDAFAKWREMKPFEYLKSKVVRRKWEIELKKLNKEIECGDLKGEELKLRMYDILNGVEKLEVSLASLEQDFSVEQAEIEQAEAILKTIRSVIDNRCNLIVKLLKVGKINVDITSAEDEVYDEGLASAVNSLEVSSVQHPLTSGDRSWSFPPPLRRDSFNFHTNDIMYSFVAIVVLGLVTMSGVKTLDFMSRNYA